MAKEIDIKNRIISTSNAPYIIAEMSANHKGSLKLATDTIRAAKEVGADAVKIQTYTPDTMTINSNKSDFYISEGLWRGRTLYELYEEAYTPFEWHEELFELADKVGITIFSSPFDETAVDLLEKLGSPAYKIASFELVDIPLIKYVAKQGKPMFLSTGMANLTEIETAIQAANTAGCKEITLFHCISGYPTPIDKANLRSIEVLKQRFDVQIGLSDHTLGITAGVVATTLGASVIEKHFTMSRSNGGVDSQFSLEPKEMEMFIKSCREAFQSLGNHRFERSDIEAQNKAFRRSLYFVKDLKKGQTIDPEHVSRIRPGYGLEPIYLESVIGAKVVSDVFRGDRVELKLLEKKLP
tara:strand:- start:1281 stop:2342 length:1062 start_codon:yes stop_codon:yes gene_type:complete